MPITPLPDAPTRNQPEDEFVPDANAFIGALPTFVTEANQLASDVEADKDAAAQSVADATTQVGLAEDQADAAAASATEAAASADAADAASNAALWVSASAYDSGDVVYSPVTFQSFRAKTNHSGVTTDPTADPTNWKLISGSDSNVTLETFTASGTFEKDDDDIAVFVEVWAGGASGGRYTASAQAGGGSGGEYVSKLFLASDLSASVAVTIGAGGAAISTNDVGNDGGDSSFGSLITALGGNGGPTGNQLTASAPRSNGSVMNIPQSRVASYGSYPFGAPGGTAVQPIGANIPLATGGNSIYGGAGGGGSQSTTPGTGGTSQFGGDGGDAADGNASDGQAPAGGGGASRGGTSGAGARGEIRVHRFRKATI